MNMDYTKLNPYCECSIKIYRNLISSRHYANVIILVYIFLFYKLFTFFQNNHNSLVSSEQITIKLISEHLVNNQYTLDSKT